jgi:hypothetical protein
VGFGLGEGEVLKNLPWSPLCFFQKFSKFLGKNIRGTLFSRKQGEGGVFALRECAQSIPRIELLLYRSYREKNFLSENDLLSGPLRNSRGVEKIRLVKQFDGNRGN